MADQLTLNIRTEPKKEAYRRIIDLALTFCDQALLVTRDTINLTQHGSKLLAQLEPFILRKISKSTQWPGTILHCNDLFPDNTATVYYFRLCTESARVLKDSVEGLFSWRQPEYPEDLCLIRSDGSPWLVSITHEEECYFQLTVQEKDKLLVDVPALDWVSCPPDPLIHG